MTFSHLPSPLLLVISSNLPSLSPSWPAINFYLISRITSAHLTSNSMVCDNTLLCPRTLFSSPMGSWLGSPQPREATQLSLFQPPEVLMEHRLGPNYSVSSLLPPRHHLYKTCLHLYLCFWMFHAQTSRLFRCHPACVHQEDCRLSLASQLHLQDRPCQTDFWLSLASQLKMC